MEKWPEDYECDGQISMFDTPKVPFEQCMNPPETEKQYEEQMKRLMEKKHEKI